MKTKWLGLALVIISGHAFAQVGLQQSGLPGKQKPGK